MKKNLVASCEICIAYGTPCLRLIFLDQQPTAQSFCPPEVRLLTDVGTYYEDHIDEKVQHAC